MFTVSVSEGGGLVAAGKLVRVIVDRDAFLANVRELRGPSGVAVPPDRRW